MEASAELTTPQIPTPQLPTRRRASRRRSPGLYVGIGIIAVLVILAIIVPIVDHNEINSPGTPFLSPSLHHLFGTDDIGRDVFVRTMDGARIDLAIAVVGVGFSLLLGTVLGVLAGISRVRWMDSILMRIVDALIAFPFIVLALVLVVILGPASTIGPLPAGLPAAFIALVAIDWAWYARLARTQTVSIRSREYVVAARLLGFSTSRIVRRHVVPSVIRINAAYAVGDAILFVIATASLAFLGAGVQPPTPEWGAIMFGGESYLQNAPWITLLPGFVLALTGLALALITDSLLDRRELR
jgi:peptide/nickel transport system permease protein